RKEEFILEEVNDNSVTFSIKPNAEMLDNYLYQFELRVVYTLNGKSIRTEFQVTNLEMEKTMPYFIGAHPAFNCPLVEGENYEDYYIEFSEVESCSIPKSFPETGLLDLQDRTPFLENQKILDLDYSLFSHDAITLDQLKSRSVTLRSRKSGKGLRVDFDDFPNLILWSTTNKSPFIALEPWSGLSTSLEEGNFLEDKRQVTKISPQETSRKIYDITILN
ncbi:aldose 1-epimerase family protein, partial [Enterococcus faecalis]